MRLLVCTEGILRWYNLKSYKDKSFSSEAQVAILQNHKTKLYPKYKWVQEKKDYYGSKRKKTMRKDIRKKRSQ